MRRLLRLILPATVLVAALVMLLYPETAHTELEDLNPEDRLTPGPTAGARSLST